MTLARFDIDNAGLRSQEFKTLVAGCRIVADDGREGAVTETNGGWLAVEWRAPNVGFELLNSELCQASQIDVDAAKLSKAQASGKAVRGTTTGPGNGSGSPSDPQSVAAAIILAQHNARQRERARVAAEVAAEDAAKAQLVAELKALGKSVSTGAPMPKIAAVVPPEHRERHAQLQAAGQAVNGSAPTAPDDSDLPPERRARIAQLRAAGRSAR